jgi:GxxExxY protein
MPAVQRNPTAEAVIGAAIDVHRCMGPGLMEHVYQTCMAHELVQRGLRVEVQVPVPVMFKGIQMACGFRMDLLVEEVVIVEVKCVERLLPIHTAQVLTYLRLTEAARQVLLFNFNGLTLKEGLRSYLKDGKTDSPVAGTWVQPFPNE